jgi:hypothetical protein
MKQKIIISALFAFSYFTNYSQTNILHLNIGSHNETNDAQFGVNYNTNYTTIKNKILEIADSINANGAKWNMQVESNFIKAVIQQDAAATSNSDLIQFLDNLSYVEIDPHNHLDTIASMNPNYNPYNYADLAHLLDSCGLSTRTNVGGFTYLNTDWTTSDENWTLWKNGLQGRSFPWYTWTPTMLWGGGTGNHTNDPMPLGVWHPAGATALSFLNNSPTNLLDMGNGCNWLLSDSTDVPALIAEIGSYIATFNSTSASTNTFYTASVMFNFRNILATNTVNKISEFLRGMKPYVTNNQVVWETLSEKRTAWLSTHNNSTDNFIKKCSDIVLGINDEMENNFISFYPNPTNQSITIESKDDIKNIQIYNLTGSIVLNENSSNDTTKTLNLQSIKNGVYFLQITTSKNRTTKKIIVNH